MSKTALTILAVTSTLFVIAAWALFDATQARADTMFSGSGPSGRLSPPAGEPWAYTQPGTDVIWGSPGGAKTTTYTGSVPAVDFEITFGSALDTAQIGTNACKGSAFCSGTLQSGTPWSTVFNPATPDSIEFVAPPGTSLTMGESYFVNIFLLPGTGVSGQAFTGRWSTSTATPLPAALPLVASGLGALGLLGWRRKRKARVSLLGAA